MTEHVLLTVEYAPGKAERQLYELMYAYINQPEKRVFAEMNQYDLALWLLGLLGSSTAAILQTIKGIVKRLQGLENAAEDILFTTFTKELADKVKINPKYVNHRGQELNNDLWEIAKWFFNRYNEKNDD